MTTYIQQMKNLREATRLVAQKLPELERLIKDRAKRVPDQDLKIMTLPDMEFHIIERDCEYIERNLYKFDPEWEYGKVETLTEQEKRGYHD